LEAPVTFALQTLGTGMRITAPKTVLRVEGLWTCWGTSTCIVSTARQRTQSYVTTRTLNKKSLNIWSWFS